jgi:D-aminopeptidase
MSGGITDVPGVRVGHRTLIDGDIRTGVTAIIPHDGDIYRDRPLAASYVINGFGKSVGLMQIDELGQLETPILLTNTLSVGACANALIRHAVRANPGIGRRLPTVNPVVGECNDGYLNDIQAMAVTEADAITALADASVDFAIGSVGAGAGMSCFGFKGGIGSASRKIRLDGADYVLGVLTLCNFGRAGDLRLPDGRRLGPNAAATPEQGSVIVVMATNIRLGSVWGHGSGDVCIGFTTANRTGLDEKSDLLTQAVLAEARIDALFHAMADATEDAVMSALMAGETTTGRGGHVRPGLRDVLKH